MPWFHEPGVSANPRAVALQMFVFCVQTTVAPSTVQPRLFAVLAYAKEIGASDCLM